MQDQGEFIGGWHVQMRYLNLEKLRRESDERNQILFHRDLDHVRNDAVQNIVWKCPWSQSVVLCRFHIVIVYHGLEFLVDGICDFREEPNV